MKSTNIINKETQSPESEDRDVSGYACVYCGELFVTYDDPSVIRCCGEVGHVEVEYEGNDEKGMP